MKKLLGWLATGLTATSLAAVFQSNLWVLISMAMFIAIPMMFVISKILNREVSTEKPLTVEPVLKTVSSNDLLNSHLARRERMRSEANKLQAELAKINQEPIQFKRVEKLSKWKIKTEVHHCLYSDLYEEIGEFSDEVSHEPRLSEASKMPN